jgi:hypothetical protein
VSRAKRRDLAVIAAELQVAQKRESADVIAIGALLLEAQRQVGYGEWLGWLKENFGSTSRTAENYMAAARFAARFETVSSLKLRPTGLYRLGRALEDDPYSLYGPKAIKAILKAAETEWINADRAEAIAVSLQPPPSPTKTEEAEAAREEAEKTEQKEIDAILDGVPPELPPAPEVTAPNVTLPPFDQAVGTLAQLQTKPLANFGATTHEPDQIRAVSEFLRAVADAIEKPQPCRSD